MTPTKGSRLSKQVALRYVMRHPIAFREYFVPQVSRRRYWGRYTFSPVLMSLDQGDTALMSGRASGKSFAGIEPELVRQSIARAGEETLITSLRRIHIVDRMERVIDYFETIPLLRLYRERVVRSPSYTIMLRTGHNLYGISTGDDPEARMAQGKHVSTLVVEEAQQYPDRAWLKLQGAKDPRGCRVLMAGVPDGRLDTPFRRADGKLASFATRRFHLSRRYDPYFDQKTKREFIDNLGGEEQDTFMQEVDAEWGHPVWSAWDLDAIYRCVEPTLSPHVVTVSGKLYRQQGFTPAAVCADLPGPAHPGAPVMISMDVGYSQPSEIGIWERWHDRWWLIARVRLVNRMEHDDQAAILHELATRYGASKVGVDTTEGEGRAIAHTMEIGDLDNGRQPWGERIVRVTFTETFLSGWTPMGEEVWEHARSIGTRTLRGLFSHKELALPPDENIPMEFNQEREARNSDGSTKVITPPTVHISDCFRVLAVMVFLETPLIPPDAETGGFAELEWGDRPSPWAPTNVGF